MMQSPVNVLLSKWAALLSVSCIEEGRGGQGRGGKWGGEVNLSAVIHHIASLTCSNPGEPILEFYHWNNLFCGDKMITTNYHCKFHRQVTVTGSQIRGTRSDQHYTIIM